MRTGCSGVSCPIRAYNGGSTCVQRTVDAYLLEGKVPKSGTVCE
ncbi:alpha/beta hydrolase [[Kitasatospora] papulosa]